MTTKTQSPEANRLHAKIHRRTVAIMRTRDPMFDMIVVSILRKQILEREPDIDRKALERRTGNDLAMYYRTHYSEEWKAARATARAEVEGEA